MKPVFLTYSRMFDSLSSCRARAVGQPGYLDPRKPVVRMDWNRFPKSRCRNAGPLFGKKTVERALQGIRGLCRKTKNGLTAVGIGRFLTPGAVNSTRPGPPFRLDLAHPVHHCQDRLPVLAELRYLWIRDGSGPPVYPMIKGLRNSTGFPQPFTKRPTANITFVT